MIFRIDICALLAVMDWARILAYVTVTVDQELLARNEYLATENRILKAQLKGRLKLSDTERATLGEIGHRLGRDVLAEVATVAKPDTILAWHRKLVACKFDGSKRRRGPGRPRIKRELERLIVRMAGENRDWGMTGLSAPWSIWGMRFPIKRSATSCNDTLCCLRRIVNAQPHGRPSFGPTSRCWQGPTSFTAEVLTVRGLVTYYVLFSSILTAAGWISPASPFIRTSRG